MNLAAERLTGRPLADANRQGVANERLQTPFDLKLSRAIVGRFAK